MFLSFIIMANYTENYSLHPVGWAILGLFYIQIKEMQWARHSSYPWRRRLQVDFFQGSVREIPFSFTEIRNEIVYLARALIKHLYNLTYCLLVGQRKKPYEISQKLYWPHVL